MNKILNAVRVKFKSLKQNLMKSGLFKAAKGKFSKSKKKTGTKLGFFAAVKAKINSSRHKVLWRTLLISVPVLLLVVSVTLAWYMNSVELWGMEFNTGSIEFNAYVYDEAGKIGENGIGPVPSTPENETKYSNIRLNSIANADVFKPSSAYIVVESTGSIGIQYRIAFDIKGGIEYLGGYTYDVTRVTELVTFDGSNTMDISKCNAVDPDSVKDPLVYIDRNAVSGTIDYAEREEGHRYDVYRVDFMLDDTGVDYAKNSIDIYFNITATQVGGDFGSNEEKGNIHNCSTKEEIDRACVEAYPGDTIKLNASIDYPGDLVFNKPINLETNDFTLKVNGNLIYDYVLGNGLRIDVGGQGKIQVLCAKNGVGGNFQIMTPISEVTLIGANSSAGDIVVERNFVIDATNAAGSPGVSFFELRALDASNSLKMIQLESNTRATVSFGTTIDSFQTVTGANYIEIINNGVIGEINLSNMQKLDHQANSPQIYILNNKDINKSIKLPSWSEPFVKNANGSCDGNTRIIQSYTGNDTSVTGSDKFDDDDIEKEVKETLVEQIDKEKNDDSRLRIYYRDDNGVTTDIQSILEGYLENKRTSVSEVVQLEIVSVGTKAVTNQDISFMNNIMSSLKQLDMQRANIYDESTGTYHRLPNNAFSGVSKYEELILPQNLNELGNSAFENSAIKNVITIPSGVESYGSRWFTNGLYVRFADSVPEVVDSDAAAGLYGVKAIFVDEAYIGSYKSEYSSYATRIYPTSVMDDSKEHFVRNFKENAWEITYYIGGADAEIGKNITLDNAILNITSVYDNAYRHTFTGTKVSFADSVENLGAGNFYENTNIAEVNLNHVKNLGDNVFYKANKLSKVDFGDALENIGANAFYYCASLNQKVNLPSTMQKIGAAAFQDTKISAVNTGGAVSVGDLAFYNCLNLIYADLPNVSEVSGTRNQLFENCKALVSVKIPSLIKANGNKMFANCAFLREVYMAAVDDELTLGTAPFNNCDYRLKIYVPLENLDFYRVKKPGNIADSRIYPQGEKMGELLINESFNIGEYIVRANNDDTYTLITSNIDHFDILEIPEEFAGKKITGIFDNAFRNQNFTDVTLKLSDNLISIGSNAFYGCSGIQKVEFGESLEEIGASAFENCLNLTQNIVLPASMESIGSAAFRNSGIVGIDAGGTKSVEAYAFYGCASMVYANMPKVTVLAASGTNEIFRNCTSLVSVDMPSLVKTNGSYIFRGCTALSEIYMGANDAAVSIGSIPLFGVDTAKIKLFVPEDLVAFYQGRNILPANQVYPRGEKLGDKTVKGFHVGDYVMLKNDTGYTLVTSNLEFTGNVVVPNVYNGQAITEIYANAFRNQSFTDVNLVLGNNVKVIGSGAFYGLSGLKSVVMDQVTTIESEAFYGSGLQALNAPKLTSIGNNAFRKCTALLNVSVPRVVNITGTYVFAECTSLKSVYFEDVKNVNMYTFSADKQLEKITINRQINSNGDNMPTAMTIDADAPCKIYVPYLSLAAYPNPWSGKPVVSFDISATDNNGNTYILADHGGRYVLIAYQPRQTSSALVLPATVAAASYGNISIYAIDEGAFSTVSDSLKSLTLSTSIAQLNGAALGECAALENIYVSDGHLYFASIGGVLYSKDGKMLVKYPAGRSESFDMTAADYSSTVGIGAGAFANAKLKQIIFPASLMVIDSTAFINTQQLSTVKFTGTTPPTLMGAGIFNTSVEGFKMIIPTTDSAVVTAYLCAYNFGEYEPYIDLNGNAGPDASTPRNQVPMSKQSALNSTFAVLLPKKDEEAIPVGLPEDETAGE